MTSRLSRESCLCRFSRRRLVLPSGPWWASLSATCSTSSGVPDSHTGDTFTFKLRFSQEIPLSYKTLQDNAFTVAGGEVIKARRLEPGKNVGWEITVRPDDDGTVTIVLPVTEVQIGIAAN